MPAKILLALLFTLGATLMTGTAAHAADIHVMASVAPRNAYLELLPGFERASGHKVITMWVPTVEMMTRLKAGEKVDLVIMASNSIDELTRLGRLVPGSRVDLVKSGIGVAVRKGAPHPDISTADKLKEALLAAKSVGYSTGPSGAYLVGLFERMGLTEALKPKLKVIQGEPVGGVVARGDAEIGFQQVPEILPVAGIDFLGPLPASIQYVSTFSAAIHVDAAQAEAARAWVKFLASPEAAPVIRKHGLDPA
jgi:molybdate transport system substrate-binding protein